MKLYLYKELISHQTDYTSITFDQSYEDETKIYSAGRFKSLNSKYGKHQINTLTGDLELSAYEDEINIQTVESTANKITINGKYIDSVIGLRDQSYVLSTDIKYGKVDYNESDVEMKRYIKADDRLELEAHSKHKKTNPIKVTIKGYEVDVIIE